MQISILKMSINLKSFFYKLRITLKIKYIFYSIKIKVLTLIITEISVKLLCVLMCSSKLYSMLIYFFQIIHQYLYCFSGNVFIINKNRLKRTIFFSVVMKHLFLSIKTCLFDMNITREIHNIKCKQHALYSK